ncbi:MAG: ABC-type transport auxiliary lipoprotein family protein [Pigmentiphaga sp.]|nr:ABC-type transport auxiliary lipoprotein family protein [Pigmentiphaga sp.]
MTTSPSVSLIDDCAFQRQPSLFGRLRAGSRWLVLGLATVLLAGCAGLNQVPPAPQVLDVGLVELPRQPLPPRAPLVVMPVEAAPLLRSNSVIWRETGTLEPNAYASFQWASPPAALFGQRLRDRLSVEGPVLNTNTTGSMPELQVSLERFEQVFDPQAASTGGASSVGDFAMRAVLTRNGDVIDQLRLALRVPASSDDATGGARALRGAVDAATENIAQWLSQQPDLQLATQQASSGR